MKQEIFLISMRTLPSPCTQIIRLLMLKKTMDVLGNNLKRTPLWRCFCPLPESLHSPLRPGRSQSLPVLSQVDEPSCLKYP